VSTSAITRLANDIAAQFAHRAHAEASRATAEHMRNFWDPRMRQQLIELVSAGGEDLDPVAMRAAARLKPPEAG
jgi:formate dehydrogenase subunit delta